ncbi:MULTISPECIES: bifunctional 2-polyprenyl-6-hydroxyphenol methylase/3-demethylubiquinol 3-O-methyltransferase UbiG [unclassified Streptomyces]|uniref:class I SAM-dependent methyltransferase n=1 Tax=unclassified Streptomyces TaxID=2593676 RepID=UPI0022561A8F|nr:methyltransferase domain-containing protein [Streptomyces sp. NBC_00047]MCX5609398.1 class I SAM-dependent methyltransferase [Streptomyces sp. NBC_00047]
MRAVGRAWAAFTAAAAAPSAPAPAAWRENPYDDALRDGHGPLFLRRVDGWLLPLEVERWCADPDAADLSALARCRGAVLDVGCGPGRLVAALAAHGHPALGIDVSGEAVARAERLGGLALCRSVFDPLPGEGRWNTVLLIDGNIGIGGDPTALLERLKDVTCPDATVIAECLAVDVDERCEVRIDNGRGGLGAPFAWARLGAPALYRHADAAGWARREQWSVDDRVFVELARRPRLRPRTAGRAMPVAP